MSEPKIIDNFLPKEVFNKISETIFSNHFPWMFSDEVSSGTDVQDKNVFQFFHVFYGNSPYCWVSKYSEIIFPLVHALKTTALIRVKANLLTVTQNIKQHNFHRDVSSINSKTAVYYVNTNNGKTRFESGFEVESVANRILIFNSNQLHAGTTCTDQSRRVVINVNFYDS